ncbi:MAG TPA: tetratricopeptide repeat protein [Candidatus Acidoferrales bacterium]
MDQRFTRSEVVRMTGATRRQLDYWARLGLVRPRARWGERFFSFTDLVAVETLNRLAQRRIPARRLLRAMDELEHRLGRARAPLSSLRVSTNGAQIVVHEPGPGGRPIEPLSGQWVLDFETGLLDRKVRALGERTAEEWFEQAMAWDANPDTFERAAEAYYHAIAAMPDWAEAHINLGTTLYQLGRMEESRQIFAKAVELDPENPLAHFNLGCAVDRLGDTQSAIEHFRAALERRPNMADAHLNLALAYEKAGRAADSLLHLARYLRIEPSGHWSAYARKRLAASRAGTPRHKGKVTPFRRP